MRRRTEQDMLGHTSRSYWEMKPRSKAPRGFPLGVPVFLPRLPVRNNSRHHVVGGLVEPFRSLLVQVAEDLLALRSSSKMDVCSLPAHGMQQQQLLAGGLARG